MRSKKKTFLLWGALLSWAAILLSLPVAEESIAIRAVALLPVMCFGSSQVVFRWPRFTAEYMDDVVNKDSERGHFSIFNLGLLMLVAAPLIMYTLFS